MTEKRSPAGLALGTILVALPWLHSAFAGGGYPPAPNTVLQARLLLIVAVCGSILLFSAGYRIFGAITLAFYMMLAILGIVLRNI